MIPQELTDEIYLGLLPDNSDGILVESQNLQEGKEQTFTEERLNKNKQEHPEENSYKRQPKNSKDNFCDGELDKFEDSGEEKEFSLGEKVAKYFSLFAETAAILQVYVSEFIPEFNLSKQAKEIVHSELVDYFDEQPLQHEQPNNLEQLDKDNLEHSDKSHFEVPNQDNFKYEEQEGYFEYPEKDDYYETNEESFKDGSSFDFQYKDHDNFKLFNRDNFEHEHQKNLDYSDQKSFKYNDQEALINTNEEIFQSQSRSTF